MSHDWPYPEILKNEKNDLKRKLLLSLLIGVSITTVTNAAPNVDYLQKKYNISSEEANMRIELQNDVISHS